MTLFSKQQWKAVFNGHAYQATHPINGVRKTNDPNLFSEATPHDDEEDITMLRV